MYGSQFALQDVGDGCENKDVKWETMVLARGSMPVEVNNSQGLLDHLSVCRSRLDESNLTVVLGHDLTNMCVVISIVSDRNIDFRHGDGPSRCEVIIYDNSFGIHRAFADQWDVVLHSVRSE